MSFAPENEPSENTGPYQSEKELIFSYLGGKKPTLLLRNGDYIGSHKINLIEIFPLAFPYGWGGPDEKRATKISKAAILRHYCRIALPQMHESQFLLVLCSMWQRMESFTKCIINYKSSYMAMPSRRPPQKSMRVGGGSLKRHQKQNRKKLRKSTRNSFQKVIQNGTALSSVQVRIMLLFFKIYVILTLKI